MNTLPIDGIPGVLVLAPCPGRGRPGVYGYGPPEELQSYRDWGAGWLITLMEQRELQWFGLESLPQLCSAAGLKWLHAPIADLNAPDAAFEAQWSEHGPQVRAHLAEGGRVVVHCLAGLGRTGTVAARILVEFGYSPLAAVDAVRQARPGSIQSEEQLGYVLGRRWEPSPAAEDRGDR